MTVADDLSMFWIHSASVETYAGDGAYGPTYSAPATTRCFLDDSIKLVRNNAGLEVVSSTTVFAPASSAAMFLPESRVTANGKVSKVITVNAMDGDALGLPSHVQVSLQ